MSGLSKKRLFRVGVFQTEVELKNREKNQENLRNWMKERYAPSDIPTAIALPELWDVGYCLDEAEAYADRGSKSALALLSGLAKQYGVWFTGGSVLAESEGRYYNRTHVIAPDGKLVAQYDKVHLLPFITSEVGVITGGAGECLYTAGDAKCGNIICYDIRFPEWVRSYALSGIDALFVSAQWTSARMDLWKTMIRAHAISNAFYIVAVNCGGMSGDISYGGGSLVCGPNGEILFEGNSAADTGFVELDLDGLAETRGFLKVFESRVPKFYGRVTHAPE